MYTFSDGTNTNWTAKDQNGINLNDDDAPPAWHYRRVDLSSFAGKAIASIYLNQETTTPAGSFDIYFNDIAIVSADGSVHPIYNRQTSQSFTMIQGGGETGATASVAYCGADCTPYLYTNTTYFDPDHIGSNRLAYAPYGMYPMWQATFLPFGYEKNAQLNAEVNNKFGTYRRDSEGSQLDYAKFRMYSSQYGRFQTPDPADFLAVDLGNPQSWNRYAYVANNPVNAVDPLGLRQCESICPNFGSDDLGGGSGGGGYVDGVLVSDALVSALLHSGSGVQCPNNICSGFDGEGNYGQFYAFAGGASGYYNPADLTHGINIVGGRLLDNANYNAYVQIVYAGPIDAQRQALAKAIAANSNGEISYQRAYEGLTTDGGHLNGGNYNFKTVFNQGQLVCGPDANRCNGIHFPTAGLVHLDTANPLSGPGGILEHFFVDIFLGNFAYTVIPRP